MRVLAIDDDQNIVEFLKSHLHSHGFVVDTAEDGESGIALACINEYDIVILDLNLPDMDGAEVIERIRSNGKTMPILMLTVIVDANSKIQLLNAGADDYLEKPFVLDELVARMRALLRRSFEITPDVLSIDDLVMDVNNQTVHRGKKEVLLTSKEFAILEYLLRNKGSLVRKTTLIEHLWNSAADPLSNAIDTHLANLRKKLGSPEVIQTVHGRGYRVE